MPELTETAAAVDGWGPARIKVVVEAWSKIVSDRSTSASIMKRESCSQLYDVEQDSRFGRHVADGAE
jgi:hypothetical protein